MSQNNTAMSKNLFTPTMKLADIIAANHKLILLLPRLGIPLGFGEKSLRDVCQSYGAPVDFVLLIFNVYTFDDYLPSIGELEHTDMKPLVEYLQASHDYYTKDRIPHIETHLNHIVDRVGGRYGQILKQFYSDYQKEVIDHFRCEEKVDFPMLQQLLRGEKPTESLKVHFEDTHASLVDKLNDLTQIVYKYLPGNVLPEETMELVFDILQISADIQKHVLIEEKILVPYIDWLERSLL